MPELTSTVTSCQHSLGWVSVPPLANSVQRSQSTLEVGLPAEPTRTRVFIFARERRADSDERDRLVADLLQPHLVARTNAADTALRAAAALAAVE
jgi:hypothetical protein